MKSIIKTLPIIIITIINFHYIAQSQTKFNIKKVYKTNSLVITQIAQNSFEHTSFKQTNDFGNVPCNGLIVRSNNEVIENRYEMITYCYQMMENCKFISLAIALITIFHAEMIKSYNFLLLV